MKLRKKDKDFFKISKQDIDYYDKIDTAYIEYCQRTYKPDYIPMLVGFLRVRLKREPDKALYLLRNMDILSSAYRLGLKHGIEQKERSAADERNQ